VLRRWLHFLDEHRSWFSWPFALSVAVLSFVAVLERPAFLEQLELKALDARFRLRGPVVPQVPVVIVAIDDESITKIGRWPWSRETIARLIERLFEDYRVRAVGFDIVFSEPQRNPIEEAARIIDGRAPQLQAELARYSSLGDADAHLASTLLRWRKRIVLGYFFYPEGARVSELTRARLQAQIERLQGSAISLRIEGASRAVGITKAVAVEGNIERIARATDLSGFFNFFPDSDGMVRRVPLLVRIGKDIYPSLDVQLLRVAMGWPEVIAEADAGGVRALRIGDRRIELALDGTMLINHYGPAKTFVHVPAVAVLQGKAPKEKLQDAIVLLGATAVGVYDFRPSPFDSAFPGVEGHAAAIANMWKEEEIRRPDGLVVAEAAAAFLLPLVLGVIAYRRGAFVQALLVVGVPLLIALFGYWLFAAHQLWLRIVYLIFASLLATVPVALLHYVLEAYKRAYIHDAFSHYLAPAVVETLAHHPELLQLGGEERVLTAMFSDIASFSSFSERMTPQQLVSFLNEYLGEMSDIILDEGGTIDKYEGDAIISFFGAPVPMDDHALRCVRAALRQQRRLAELRERWVEQGLPAVHMRIGINTGEMVVGNMGTERRMNYTIMGDQVNLAARLEGVCKVYRVPILISRQTYERVRDAIQARFIDRVRVVGRKQPVDIYQPLGERGTVPEEEIRRYRLYERAWVMMTRRMFEDAEKAFAHLALECGDAPAEVMLARVRQYKQKPPPHDWDGVYQLEQK